MENAICLLTLNQRAKDLEETIEEGMTEEETIEEENNYIIT